MSALGPSHLKEHKNQDNLAYLSWFCGSVFWILGFIYPNEHNIDILSNNITRALGLLIFNGLYLYSSSVFCNKPNMNKSMTPKSVKFISLRHVLLSMYSFVFSQSHFYLPPPIVYTIFFSGPLFVLAMQYLIFKSTITKSQLIGAILATIGVLLTANGIAISQIFSAEENSEFITNFEHYKTESPLVKSIAALILIAFELAWAYAVILVRYTDGKVSHFEANFNLGIILSIFVGVIYQFKSENSFKGNLLLFGKAFVCSGLVLAVSQACFMQALLMSEKKGTIAMIGFLGVIFSYFLSVFRYGEEINEVCLIGVVLVIYGIYKIVIKKAENS